MLPVRDVDEFEDYASRMDATTAAKHGRIYWGDHLTLYAAAALYAADIRVTSSLESTNQRASDPWTQRR